MADRVAFYSHSTCMLANRVCTGEPGAFYSRSERCAGYTRLARACFAVRRTLACVCMRVRGSDKACCMIAHTWRCMYIIVMHAAVVGSRLGTYQRRQWCSCKACWCSCNRSGRRGPLTLRVGRSRLAIPECLVSCSRLGRRVRQCLKTFPLDKTRCRDSIVKLGGVWFLHVDCAGRRMHR